MSKGSKSRAKSRAFARAWNEARRREQAARDQALFLARERAREEELRALHRELSRRSRAVAYLATITAASRAHWSARFEIILDGVDSAAVWAKALFGDAATETDRELIALDGLGNVDVAKARWRERIEVAMKAAA